MKVTKVQELIYNLPIEHVMKKDVITVTPDITIRQLKEILKDNRISGVPVLEEGRLVGIISIEDLIKALEDGELNCPVGQRMSTNLITVTEKETVIEAVKKFSRFRVGRLLVLNYDGDLTGILTGSDITKGLLEAISLDYQTDEGQKNSRIIFRDDIVSDQTSLILRYRIQAKDFKNGGQASSRIKHALERLGGSPEILRRVAISAYEAEMNLIIHTDAGGELITEMRPDQIIIRVVDQGPGIADLEQALRPGFSTAPAWIQELGFGAGMGLANIKKCADLFKIESTPGKGTQLEIIINI